MKKITYIVLATIVTISFTSCKKYLDDVAVSPNSPESSGPKALLASVEIATFANYTGNNARRSCTFIQQIAGTGFQMTDVQNYLVLESDVTNDWLTIYAGAIVNAQIIIDDYGTESPHYGGIAKVLKAMNLGLATDMWGDVPSKQAGKGIVNLNPTYDLQQAVYADIQTILNDAITDLKRPLGDNKQVPTFDYIFGGDPNHWIQTAYVLKARYANRLSNRSASQSATDALTYLNAAYAAGLASSGDDAMAVFGDQGNENNQWANFNATRSEYIKMAAFFIDTMNLSKDPRLPFFADPVTGTTYAGAENISANDAATSSDIGDYCDVANAPLPMVSFVEAKFIEAECQLRLGNSAGAAAAHNEAVKESISAVTGAPSASYEAGHAAETAGSISLARIIMEKYKALFTQVEVWTDWRRTGYPALSPNPDGNVSGIPRRLPTSVDERNYNTNAVVETNLLKKMWFEN
jgi:hypothetical protein